MWYKAGTRLNLISPVAEIREINGANYQYIVDWINEGAQDPKETATAYKEGKEVTIYIPTFTPDRDGWGINNRLDFTVGVSATIYSSYIAKLANGRFIVFDSLHLESACEEISE
jgi:hypothetical protein